MRISNYLHTSMEPVKTVTLTNGLFSCTYQLNTEVSTYNFRKLRRTCCYKNSLRNLQKYVLLSKMIPIFYLTPSTSSQVFFLYGRFSSSVWLCGSYKSVTAAFTVTTSFRGPTAVVVRCGGRPIERFFVLRRQHVCYSKYASFTVKTDSSLRQSTRSKEQSINDVCSIRFFSNFCVAR